MAAPTDTRVRDDYDDSVRTDRGYRSEVVDREGWAPTFGPGLVLGGLAAIGLIISLFTRWTDGGADPQGIPVAFLGDNETTSTDPSMLIVLIPLALVILVGAFVPFGGAMRVIGGLLTLVVCGLFAFQTNESLEALGGSDLGDALGTGFYVAAIAGFLAFVSGFVPEGWFRRREVVRTDV
jgi:hypothetical protein